jgi:hypothetical protein
LDNLKKYYEEQFIGKSISNWLRKNVQYQVMRQTFINPVELPVLTESFLRRDFNFAMYLGFSLSEYLSDVFSFLSLRVFGFVVFLLLVWKCINFLDITYGAAIVYCIPLMCVLGLLFVEWRLGKILNGLIPPIN